MLVALIMFVAAAMAHPFGSSLYGHKTLVLLDGDEVRVEYLAEIPTPDLLRDLGAALRGVENPGPDDQQAFVDAMLDELEGGLRLTVGGQPVPWERLPSEEQSGVGDSRFIKFHLSLRAPVASEAQTLVLVDGNLPDQRALFSTELRVSDAIVVDDCNLFVVEDEQLSSDKSGDWRMEEENRELRISFRRRTAIGEAFTRGFSKVAGRGDDAFQPASERLASVHNDPLTAFVTGELTVGLVMLALGASLFFGAAHALSPGHGKALVAAYLLGSRQTVWHAVWLGIIVTVTHTAAVFLLGFVALLLAEYVAPEDLLPWLEVASGLLVLGIGARLLQLRLGSARGPGHGHDHGHAHASVAEPAMAHDHGAHDHAHATPPADAHGHAHAHGLAEVFHEAEECHALHPADADEHGHAHARQYAEASWRSLVALGVSGGLAPCPTALVILLTAISFHRTAFGIAMVVAFSLGLAAVVTAVGVAVVLLGDRFRNRRATGPLTTWLPVVSAIVVTLIGIAVTWRGIQAVLG